LSGWWLKTMKNGDLTNLTMKNGSISGWWLKNLLNNHLEK
jgi:hypothetical protein